MSGTARVLAVYAFKYCIALVGAVIKVAVISWVRAWGPGLQRPVARISAATSGPVAKAAAATWPVAVASTTWPVPKSAAGPIAGMRWAALGITLLCFFYRDDIPVKKSSVKVVNSVDRLVLVGIFHKAESARHASCVVNNNFGRNDLTEFCKQGTQFRSRCFRV